MVTLMYPLIGKSFLGRRLLTIKFFNMKHAIFTFFLLVAFTFSATAESLDRTNWTATTSERFSGGSGNLPNMFDGSLETDWSTLNVLEPGDWMIIDIQSTQTFNEIVMDQTKNNGDCPNGFSVYVSDNPDNFGTAIATGKGTNAPQSSIIFAEQTARYIKIELTESKGAYWAVTEMYVNLSDVDYRFGWTAAVSTNLDKGGNIANMFDNNFETDWSSLNILTPGDYLLVDMKAVQTFNQIVLDQTKNNGDCPNGFSVFLSNDGVNWGDAVATGKGVNGPKTTVDFMESQSSRYIKIELTEDKGAYWAITEFHAKQVRRDYRFGWTATSSLNSNNLAAMFDDDLATDWSSEKVLAVGDWMIIDMLAEKTFNQLVFDQANTPGDCMNGFAVYVTNNLEDWGEIVAESRGVNGAQTKITFLELTGRYIKIELTEDKGAWWKVSEFNIGLVELDYRFGWTASTSERLSNDGLATMFDADLTTDWESGNSLVVGDWMIIDMLAEQTFNQIILDQTAQPGDRLNNFDVYVSNDGTNWGEAIASGRGVEANQTKVTFFEQTARYIKIEATETTGGWWKVTEFDIDLVELDYRFGWTATISEKLIGNTLANMFDADLATDWASENVLTAGDYLIVDMLSEKTINLIRLVQANTPGDCPNGFSIYVANDLENWGEAVAESTGVNAAQTEVRFEAQTGRYIKIEITEATEGWWKITEFHAMEVGYRYGWTATAFNRAEGGMLELFDDNITTGWNTSMSQEPGQWVIVDMKEPQTFNQIILGIDTKHGGDYPRGYEVYVSNDPENWGEAIVTGVGNEGGETKIEFADEQTGQYVKIVQTSTFELWWAIDEFNINTVTDRDYRFGWTVTVSANLDKGGNPANMFDNNLETEWSSLSELAVGDYMIIDMQSEQTFNLIALDQTKNNGDCPNGFVVYASNDLDNFGEAIATGRGVNGAQTLITFEEQTARYAKIELTETKGAYWAVTELNIKQGDYRYGWTITASNNEDKTSLALDSDLSTRWDSGPQTGAEWIIVDMKAAQDFNTIIMDQNGGGDYPREYIVYVTNDLENWGEAVATGNGTNGITKISLADQNVRYIKIEQIGNADGIYWSINEFDIEKTVAIKELNKEENNVKLYYSNGQIYLQGVTFPTILNIYSISGQKLKSIEVNQDIISVNLASGIYIITLNNSIFSHKLLVK